MNVIKKKLNESFKSVFPIALIVLVLSMTVTPLDAGDMLYKAVDGAGHTRMVAAKPKVTRKDDGTIDRIRSFVTVIEQTNAWYTSKKDTSWFLDKKYSFAELYDTAFMPITLKFFNEENPVEAWKTLEK